MFYGRTTPDGHAQSCILRLKHYRIPAGATAFMYDKRAFMIDRGVGHILKRTKVIVRWAEEGRGRREQGCDRRFALAPRQNFPNCMHTPVISTFQACLRETKTANACTLMYVLRTVPGYTRPLPHALSHCQTIGPHSILADLERPKPPHRRGSAALKIPDQPIRYHTLREEKH